jgi:predicted MFS family arabinose efflux permease
MLLTGTPLAWLMELSSWRAGFWVLGGCSVVAWLAIWRLVHEPADAAERPQHPAQRESVWGAIRRFGALFALPHTAGILALAFVTYAAFISLRGLWLGPLLIERHGYSLVQSGNVALIVSVSSMFGPPLFGRFDPGGRLRRQLIMACGAISAALFALLASNPGAAFDVGGSVFFGIFSGFIVLQYADVRAAYPAALIGRAMAVFTMAMFLGVALMQWLTGLVASIAKAHGVDPFIAVLATIAVLLAAGTLAFALLPGPPKAPR